jgi:hypothetical protein
MIAGFRGKNERIQKSEAGMKRPFLEVIFVTQARRRIPFPFRILASEF